jgi:SAM-dependent methyltransferase
MIKSPYGFESDLVERLHVSEIARRYKAKCGADISSAFGSLQFAELYQCKGTGYKFWLPNELAGDEKFYQLLSKSYPNYYGTTRWEYAESINIVNRNDVCLEIGCGRGYFIKAIESKCSDVFGLELNSQAINEKVCQSEISLEDISVHAERVGQKYDKIFTFQVLEHIPNPQRFIANCLLMLKPGGYLVISVPNDDYIVHKNMADAFNLPPHHMGCYNADVFYKLSKIFNIELVNISNQPPVFPQVDVTNKMRQFKLWNRYFRIFSWLGGRILTHLNEPGHTMLVIFRKSHE